MKETRFKQTDIGLIPEDWELKTLGELSAAASYGVSAEAINYNGIVKYIRITDIDDTSGCYKPSPLTSPSFWSNQHLVIDNDLLVARTGASVGKSYVYDKRDGKMAFAGFLMKLNIDKANARFVFYWTQTESYRALVSQESMRTGQPGLNIVQLKSFCLPTPTANEQNEIAAALSDVDAMISELGKLVEKKQLIKQGAMQQLLTARRRLPGFIQPWQSYSINEIFTFIGNNTLSRDQLAEQGSVLNIHYGDILVRFPEILDVSAMELPYIACRNKGNYPLKNGDVILADTAEDETVGKAVEVIGITNKEVEAGLHTMVLRPSIPFAERFLGFYINSSAFHDLLLPHIQGIKVSSISKKAVMSLTMTVPSDIAEQQAIADILTDMDSEIDSLRQRLAKLRQLRAGMMQQLLTGRIRLVTPSNN